MRACRTKPRISPLVDAWKGILKPLALAGIAFTAVAGFFHWVLAGPNEVQPEDEAEARRLLHPADDSRWTHPKGTLTRNTAAARINHWITGGCFVLRSSPASRCFIQCCSSWSELFAVANGLGPPIH